MMPTDQSHWSCGASQAIAAERLSKVTYMQEAEISAVKSERAESEQARAEQARAAEISSLREQIRALGDEKSAMQKTHEAVRYA